jgi:hypothetical protein
MLQLRQILYALMPCLFALVISACGNGAGAGHLADAPPSNDGDGRTTVAFASGEDWPSYAGDLTGAQGASLGTAKAVCVGPTAPANCPSDALRYRTSGSGWNAMLTAAPGAVWIWRADVSVTGLADLQFAIFEKTFDLGANPTGTIEVAADDFVAVGVNGAAVGSAGSVSDETLAYAGQAKATSFDLGPHLHSGPNIITVVAQNGPQSFGGCASPCTFATNTAGVVFAGTLTSQP